MKQQLILFLFIVSFYQSGKTQVSVTDSLKKLLMKSQEDTLKVNCLTNLAIEYRKSNLDTALNYGKEALILSSKLNWRKGIGFSNHILGVISYMRDEKQESLNFNKAALAIWNELSKSLDTKEASFGKLYIAKTSITNANIFIDQANYTRALEYSFSALKTVEKLGDKKVQGIVLGNIGNIYVSQGDLDKALEYYNKALIVGSELEDPIFILNQYNSIASVYRQKNELDKALLYYKNNLKLAEEYGVIQVQAGANGNIGLIYLEQNKYEEAINQFQKALKIAEKVGDKGLIVFNKTNLGSAYRRIGKFSEAEKQLNEALELAELTGNPKSLMAIEDNLGNLYEETKKPELALEHFKNYVILRDSITNQENRKELYRSELNYTFEKKEMASKAEQEKKDAIAYQERQKQKLATFMISSILFIVVIFSFILFRKFKLAQRQKRIIELQKEEVTHQKNLIEDQKKLVDQAYETLHEKNREVIDSIHYAKRIQTALLPRENYIHKTLKRDKK